MRLRQHHEVIVTLSSATFARLERGNPFNKHRVAEQAIETIRVALLTMYPPRTPEEWNDQSRYEGAIRHVLLVTYDMLCYALRRLVGRADKLGSSADHHSDEPVQITLKIPAGMMSWIEKIARSRQSTVPEATVYAIEYGLQVLDSQDAKGDGLRKVWGEIWRAIRKRFVGSS